MSKDNPYFFKGTAGEGIGGPHIGYDMIWPMSIMMKAFTSQDDKEIVWCVKTLMNTDADTGFIHESFHMIILLILLVHGLHGKIHCLVS